MREERQKLKDEKDALALEVHRQVDAQLAQREAQVRAQEQERTALRKGRAAEELDDMKAQVADMQRKAEQGSQQLQGEVLELALEEGLRRAFPLDRIEEVKKGVRGGDVIHHVQSRIRRGGGRAAVGNQARGRLERRSGSPSSRKTCAAAAADVGVLVTTATATPREWTPGTQFGAGGWTCGWSPGRSHCSWPRRCAPALLDVHKQRVASAGKDEKMEAVYDYVTSPQFAQKLKGVLEAFQRMREELESEKNQTLQRWARREKQLEAGKMALLGVGGDIQGLAQQDLPQLELDSDTTGSVAVGISRRIALQGMAAAGAASLLSRVRAAQLIGRAPTIRFAWASLPDFPPIAQWCCGRAWRRIRWRRTAACRQQTSTCNGKSRPMRHSRATSAAAPHRQPWRWATARAWK